MGDIERLEIDIARFRSSELDNATLKALLEDAYSKINELVDYCNELAESEICENEMRDWYRDNISSENS